MLSSVTVQISSSLPISTDLTLSTTLSTLLSVYMIHFRLSLTSPYLFISCFSVRRSIHDLQCKDMQYAKAMLMVLSCLIRLSHFLMFCLLPVTKRVRSIYIPFLYPPFLLLLLLLLLPCLFLLLDAGSSFSYLSVSSVPLFFFYLSCLHTLHTFTPLCFLYHRQLALPNSRLTLVLVI